MSLNLFLNFFLFFLISINLEVFAKDFIILQSTTSARDSGLYDYILPDFLEKKKIEVRVIAVGTGQAIENSKRCDADVLIVHHKESEEEFIDQGYGLWRKEFMYNDFVLVGPKSDPGDIQNKKSIISALRTINNDELNFVSRGDNSGTHQKEKSLWSATKLKPNPKFDKWYFSVGQGMGGAINIAVNKDAYILSDRSTWLSFNNKRNHTILVENEPLLLNFYGVIPINPKRCPKTKVEDAKKFVDWLLSDNTRNLISFFRKNGQQLFFPTN